MPENQKKKCTKLPYYYFILPKTPIPLAKQHFTSERCECGCHIRLEDTQKNELLCPNCGLVHKEGVSLTKNNLVYGCWSKNELYTGNGYTPSEKEFMQQKGIKIKSFIGNHELNQLDYKYLIDVFKTELCLNDVDINNVWLIIHQCKGLKNIHSKLNYEKIILGICRYILKQKGITGYLVNLNNTIYRDYNLSTKEYFVIEKNIEKYSRLYRCNT